MKYKLAASGGSEIGWVINSEDNTISIRCREFEVSVPTKTVIENSKAWLEFETKQSNFKYDVAPIGSPRLTNGVDTEYHDDEMEIPDNSSGSEDDETETPPSNEDNEIETRTPMKIV